MEYGFHFIHSTLCLSSMSRNLAGLANFFNLLVKDTSRFCEMACPSATLTPLDLEMNPCQSLAVETFQRGSVSLATAWSHVGKLMTMATKP